MKRTHVIIDLVIEHKDDEQAVVGLVDNLLDAGFLQDAINEHDAEDVGELKVRLATCRLGDGSVLTVRLGSVRLA